MKSTLFAILAILIAGFGLCIVSGPVLFTLADPGNVTDMPLWSAFNPLRDRAPEVAGDTFLGSLRAGEYDKALNNIPLDAERRLAAEQYEKDHPLVSWELQHRRISGGKTELQYHVETSDMPGLRQPAKLYLEQDAQGRWMVVQYQYF